MSSLGFPQLHDFRAARAASVLNGAGHIGVNGEEDVPRDCVSLDDHTVGFEFGNERLRFGGPVMMRNLRKVLREHGFPLIFVSRKAKNSRNVNVCFGGFRA
jgi:hypothetical protein